MSSDYSIAKSMEYRLVGLEDRFSRRTTGAGTANRGVQILWWRDGASLLLVFVAALMTIACGGSSSSNLRQKANTNGALYSFVGDTPSCDVLSLGTFLTSMSMHQAGKPSTSQLAVWPTITSPTSPVVEMSTLRDIMTVANLASVPPGTYDQIIMKVVVNSASTYDPTQSPPFKRFSPTITSDSVIINLQPALTVTSGKVSALMIDLNLPQSLNVDSQGQLTGTVTWVFSGFPIVPSGSNGFGEMDSMYGFVRTVNSSSPGAGFTSSFLLQTQSATAIGNGPALNVDLTDSTDLCMNGVCGVPVSQIDQLTTGSYVEVYAYIDQNGNVVAKRIQVEDRESVTDKLLAYVGPVLDVTKDANGKVTQFDMLVRETEPPDPSNIPNSTAVTVYVSQSTTFNHLLISPDIINLASSGNLDFAVNALVPGQEVVVHGVYSKASGGITTVAANSVFPRFQAVQGMFSSLAGNPASDNKTGAFQMAPCNGLLSSNPFMVVTDGQTLFENTSGLSTLSPSTPVLVRGEMFYNVGGSTINGVQIPAGTAVLVANRVRQF
ncbi:MAG: hypothetical protein EPN47_13570 [Acidobacteria bacterium]|nr:MAG: hypothetical protein EPN47_13570 [Acidobacteriota bacterium]